MTKGTREGTYFVEHPLDDAFRNAEVTRAHTLVQPLQALTRQDLLGHRERRQHPNRRLPRYRRRPCRRTSRLFIRENPFLVLCLEL